MGGISINSLEPVGNCMGMQNNKQEEEKRNNNTRLSFADMLYQNSRLNHKKAPSEKEEEKEQEPKEPVQNDSIRLSYMMMNNYISSINKKDEEKKK